MSPVSKAVVAPRGELSRILGSGSERATGRKVIPAMTRYTPKALRQRLRRKTRTTISCFTTGGLL